MDPITSPKNPRVKRACHLRERRARHKQARFLIDGARELARARAAGIDLAEVFYCAALCKDGAAIELVEQLEREGMPVVPVTRRVFQKLAYGERAEGVVGVARLPEASLDGLQLPDSPLVAVLERVEKPGNVGAIARSADGAGLAGLIVADARTDLYNPNAIRASLGTLFALSVAAATTEETLNWLRQRRFRILAARVDGNVPYTKADYRGAVAIALGSEAEGLSGAFSGEGVTAVRLPMHGVGDSLNVSAAAALLFYEAARQRAASP